jgi:flagellar assembly factor FliW
MHLDTPRFGPVSCDAGDVLLFPEGLIGFEPLHLWTVLYEGPLIWLQAVEDCQVSVPVASPFHVLPHYSLTLPPRECRPLQLDSPNQAIVLAVIGQRGSEWTLNLRAPILIRPEVRLGRQVIAGSEHSLQHVLPRFVRSPRKSA